jgi:phosphate ABC transporter permease protein PstC
MVNRNSKEKLIGGVFLACAVSSIVIVFMIFLSVAYIGLPAVSHWLMNGFGMDWSINFGIIPYIFSTVYVGLGATVVASIIGVPCAIYLAEFADRKLRNTIKPSLEILTGFPSVVMGIVGVILICGMIQQALDLDRPGFGVLAAWIVLGVMSLPHVASISEDSMRAVPHDLKEASLALGATKWQTTTKVIIPSAKSGILAAIMLGMGNAIGETMAVYFVIGRYSSPPMDVFALTTPTNVIPSLIASANIRGAEGNVLYEGIFAAGFVLFAIILLINFAVRRVVKQSFSGGRYL